MSLWRFASFLVVAHAQCVTKQTLKAGDGMTFPKSGDSVTMQYTGYLASNGQKFDSSLDHGGSFTTQIGVGKVITGWDQGVPQMTLGEHAMLHISADCGYGAQGAPPSIPPNADLNFDVVLLAINGQRAGASVPAAPAFPATLTATLGASFPSTSQTSKLGKATRKRVSNGLPAQATVSFASTFPTAPATQSLPALGNLPATVVGASFPSSFSSNTQFQGSFAHASGVTLRSNAPCCTSSHFIFIRPSHLHS
jgi:FK506-binding protein 1